MLVLFFSKNSFLYLKDGAKRRFSNHALSLIILLISSSQQENRHKKKRLTAEAAAA